MCYRWTMELISLKKGYKKTVCPDGKYFHQNKLFFIFTLIIFSEHSYFLRKSQITPEWKQRKKIFFNSICTPLEHPDSPQSLYLWAFSQFSPLLKLANKILLLYFLVLVLWFYLVLYVFNCPKSIGCTERCYQIVIMIVLSIIFSLKRLKQLLAIHLTLQQSVLE